MPAAVCLRTTSTTASRTSLAQASRSYGWPRSCARRNGIRASGRDRLPTWVVRIRSVLRFMATLPGFRRASGSAPRPSHSEIPRLHLVVGHELGGGAGMDDGALAEHVHVVRQVEREPQVLLDEQDRD